VEQHRIIWIASTVGVALAMAVMIAAARRGRPVVDPTTGLLLFRHGLLLRGFSIFAAFGIPIAITALVIASPPKPHEYGAVIFLYALFAGLSVPLLWESLRFAVIVGPDGIDGRSPWRGQVFMGWEDIEEVSYNPSWVGS
jgi:hypothetical protein